MSEQASDEVKKLTTCPACGKKDPNLVTVDSGLRLTMQKAGRGDIPDSVCSSCLKNLRRSASHGAQQLAAQELKANQAGQLWKTRTSLVKQGHMLLKNGDYSQAAVCYEKYLKILCIVIKVEDRKQLDPKKFNEHPKEITIICSVLWDLMLIYDANLKFNSRQIETAEILAKFLRFSPIYNAIIRKAEKEVRKSKNPQAFRLLLKLCDAQASRCFIANEAFGSRVDPTVMNLCLFRDQILRQSPRGRDLIAFYYRHSPKAAALLRKRPWLKSLIRPVLRAVAIVLVAIFRLPPRAIS
jgi:hypothetical protein